MNDFEKNGLVTELKGMPNVQYIINEDNVFALTEFKVLKGQNKNLVNCSKVKFNGKIKLIYFTNEMKSLQNILATLDVDSFINIIANLVSSVSDIKNNGFLDISNLVLSFDRIFVDANTLAVNLVYLPINNPYKDNTLQENELKAEIIKFIGSVPAFATDKMSRITGYLSNGTLTLSQLYSCLCGEVAGVRQVVVSDGKQQKEEIKSSVRKTLVFSCVLQPSVSFNINSNEFVIGKSADKVDGLITFNKAISRVHCKIIYQNGNYYIIDLGSANGTYVNSKKLQVQSPEPINNGDKVRLANVDFTITI